MSTIQLNLDEMNHLNAGYPVHLDLGDTPPSVITLQFKGTFGDAARLIDDRKPSIPDHLPWLGSDHPQDRCIKKINAIITYLKETHANRHV